MKIFPNKKISLLTSGIFLWQLLVLPVQSLASNFTYEPLEGKVFDGFAKSGDNQLFQFLSQAFGFGLALAAALAVIMIVWGGVEIMLSESVFKKEDGKKKIWDAIWGLILALISWLILYIINPEILNFKL